MVYKVILDLPLGENIACLRKASGFKQFEVVAKMQLMGSSMTRTGYVKIERGARNIKVSDLIILRDIFNVSYDAFFAGLELPETDTQQATE